MKSYFTSHREYQVTEIQDFEAITAPDGLHKGKLYGIVGFLGDKIRIGTKPGTNQTAFYSADGSVQIDFYDLNKYLDDEGGVGKRIVAILLDGRKQIVTHFEPEDMIITSAISEVKYS